MHHVLSRTSQIRYQNASKTAYNLINLKAYALEENDVEVHFRIGHYVSWLLQHALLGNILRHEIQLPITNIYNTSKRRSGNTREGEILRNDNCRPSNNFDMHQLPTDSPPDVSLILHFKRHFMCRIRAERCMGWCVGRAALPMKVTLQGKFVPLLN
jgi:hypothetical protein